MRTYLPIAAACLALTISSTSHAAVANGDFEAGSLTGWTLSGQGTVKTAAMGVTPPTGTYQGYIDTEGNFTLTAPSVASALGIPGSAIAGLGQGTPTNGTGLSQLVTVSAGDVLTFDWNFVTSELSQSSIYNDFSFYTINTSAFFLGSRNGSTFNIVSPPAGFEGQTNWSTVTYTFPSAGVYRIGYGVFNEVDGGHNSALLLDNVAIVPEPTSLGLLAISGILLRRHR